MTEKSDPGATIAHLIQRMRSDTPRFGCHTTRANDVVAATTVDGWADELEAVLRAQPEPTENEHAGGSLNGPSRLGASPNTDTGGECVLVPRSLVSAALNLFGATSVGLHGTPWAQSEIQALIKAFDQVLGGEAVLRASSGSPSSGVEWQPLAETIARRLRQLDANRKMLNEAYGDDRGATYGGPNEGADIERDLRLLVSLLLPAPPALAPKE